MSCLTSSGARDGKLTKKRVCAESTNKTSKRQKQIIKERKERKGERNRKESGRSVIVKSSRFNKPFKAKRQSSMPLSDLRVHNGGSRSHKGNHSMKDEVLTGIERLAPDHVYIHKLNIFPLQSTSLYAFPCAARHPYTTDSFQVSSISMRGFLGARVYAHCPSIVRCLSEGGCGQWWGSRLCLVVVLLRLHLKSTSSSCPIRFRECKVSYRGRTSV